MSVLEPDLSAPEPPLLTLTLIFEEARLEGTLKDRGMSEKRPWHMAEPSRGKP